MREVTDEVLKIRNKRRRVNNKRVKERKKEGKRKRRQVRIITRRVVDAHPGSLTRIGTEQQRLEDRANWDDTVPDQGLQLQASSTTTWLLHRSTVKVWFSSVQFMAVSPQHNNQPEVDMPDGRDDSVKEPLALGGCQSLPGTAAAAEPRTQSASKDDISGQDTAVDRPPVDPKRPKQRKPTPFLSFSLPSQILQPSRHFHNKQIQ